MANNTTDDRIKALTGSSATIVTTKNLLSQAPEDNNTKMADSIVVKQHGAGPINPAASSSFPSLEEALRLEQNMMYRFAGLVPPEAAPIKAAKPKKAVKKVAKRKPAPKIKVTTIKNETANKPRATAIAYKEEIAQTVFQEEVAPPMLKVAEPKKEFKVKTEYKIEDTESLIEPGLIVHVSNGIFKDELPHPLVLFIALMHMFGNAYLEWEPETLREHLAELGVTDISDAVMDSIHAVIAAHRTNDFYAHWRPFELIANGLNYKHVDFENMMPLTMPEMANAINIIAVIRTDDKFTSYGSEIPAYIETLGDEDGWLVYPEVIPVKKEQDKDFINETMARARVLYEKPEDFNIGSPIDCQALKNASVIAYCDLCKQSFTDQVKKYIKVGE